MAKRKKKTFKPLPLADFEKIKELMRKNKLEKVVAGLDPDDVRGSISRAPKEVVRFMAHVLVNVKDVEEKAKTLKAEERIPLESLLEAARKYKGEEFAKAFHALAAEDEALRRDFGVVVQKVKSAVEAKIDNSIDRIVCIPHFRLRTKRVYTEISLMQNDQPLLRVNAELDEVLSIARLVLNGAEETLHLLEESVKGQKPNIRVGSCTESLDGIDEDVKAIRNRLAKYCDGPTKSRKRVKSREAKKTRAVRRSAKR